MNAFFHRLTVLALALGSLIIAVYGQTATYDFAYDDSARIKREVLVTRPWSGLVVEAGEILSSPTFPGDLYRPLTTASYRLDYLIFGLKPYGFHVTNVLYHLSTCILLLVVATTVFRLSNAAAFAVALLFALHPLQVETVASLAGRSEILAAFFCLLAIQFRMRHIVSGLFLLCSAVSKESGLVSCGLFLLSLWFEGGRPALTMKRLLSIAAVVVTALILRYVALGEHFFVQRPEIFVAENPLLEPGLNFFERVIPSFVIAARYAVLLILPLKLSADYSMSKSDFWMSIWSFPGLASGLLVICLCLFVAKTNDRFLKFSLLWILLAFSLTINLLTPIGTLMAERLCYLPLIGFSCVLYRSLTRFKLHAVLIVLIAVLYTVIAVGRMPVWANDRVLMLQLPVDAPNSPKAHTAAGREFLHFHNDLPRAEWHLKRALDLDGSRVEAMRELVDLNMRRKDLSRAAFWATKILKLLPQDIAASEFLEKLDAFKQPR